MEECSAGRLIDDTPGRNQGVEAEMNGVWSGRIHRSIIAFLGRKIIQKTA